jgi:hypothetical protein
VYYRTLLLPNRPTPALLRAPHSGIRSKASCKFTAGHSSHTRLVEVGLISACVLHGRGRCQKPYKTILSREPWHNCGNDTRGMVHCALCRVHVATCVHCATDSRPRSHAGTKVPSHSSQTNTRSFRSHVRLQNTTMLKTARASTMLQCHTPPSATSILLCLPRRSHGEKTVLSHAAGLIHRFSYPPATFRTITDISTSIILPPLEPGGWGCSPGISMAMPRLRPPHTPLTHPPL